MNPQPLTPPEGWTEVPQMEFDYVMGQIKWSRVARPGGVLYVIEGEPMGLELDGGKCWLHPRFFKPEEPDSIEEIRKMFGADEDGPKCARIWFEFRYALKKATQIGDVHWSDIRELLRAAMKRVRKEVGDPTIRNQVNGRFMVMMRRCEEFIKDPEAAKGANEVCPTCQLNRLICPCEKQDPKLKA